MPVPDTNFQKQLTVYKGSPGGSVVKPCRHEDDSYFDLPQYNRTVEKDDLFIESLETLKKTRYFFGRQHSLKNASGVLYFYA